MLRLIVILFVMFIRTAVPAQNFIGMSIVDIKKVMNEKHHSFDIDEGAKNATYKYLKYVDKFNEETWLFFLTENDVCTHTKLISDFSNMDLRIKELNQNYKKIGKTNWIYNDKGITYDVILTKEEWFFTIVTKKK